MKKLATILSVMGAAYALSAQDGNFPVNSIVNPSIDLFRVSASVGYESEYVFRSERRATDSVQPKVEFSYPVLGFDVYCGTWMNFPVDRKGEGSTRELTEVDLYAGVNYSYGAFTLDVGFIYYWYTDTPYYTSSNYEAYVGVTFDTAAYLGGVNLNPSIYYYYNFEFEQSVVEISVGYDMPVGRMLMGWERLSMPMRVYAGWLTADKRNGSHSTLSGEDWNTSYAYAGATLDLAYMLTEFCTVSAGVRYSYTTNPDAGRAEGFELNRGFHDHLVWFGAKVDFGF